MHSFLARASLTGRVARLVAATATGQSAVLLSTPLIARIYSQAEIGEFGLFLSFLTGSAVAVTARYELSLPSVKDDDEAEDLLRIALILCLPLCVLFALVFAVFIKLNLLSFGLLPWWSGAAMFPALLAAGLFSVVRFWLVRMHRYKDIGSVLITQGLGRALIPIGLGIFQAGTAGLVAGEVIGRVMGLGRVVGALRRPPHSRNRPGGRRLLRVARKNWKYPCILLPSGLFDMVTSALPVPLISYYYGVSAAGAFLIVQRLSTAPALLVGTSAGDVFHTYIVERMVDGTVSARTALMRWSSRLLVLGAAVLIPAAALAPFLLPWVLGPRWRDSGLLFAALAPWSLAMLVVSPLSRLMVVAERKELKLIYDLTALIALVVTVVEGGRLRLPLITTVVIASVGQAAAYCVYFGIIYFACGERTVRGAPGLFSSDLVE